ncbi:tRNA (guanine(10)-N2)-dimethyltransferase [uncultured archaeon]|nr:tRNA (guanine(10)-N2)-dimethyltransferase [uncultured archaeon]
MSTEEGKKVSRKKEIGKNGVVVEGRGVYDRRNKLNELTGEEWVYFTNSVWITGYSPTATENVGLKYRKIHPSPKPPGLIRDIIKFFTKSDALILDPFVGVGGTLLGAAMAGGGRTAIGIDLEEKYMQAYNKVCETENLKKMQYVIGDSKKIMGEKNSITEKKYDLIIADPPYSDMMSKTRTGQRVKLYDSPGATPYSDKEADLGNMNEERFLASLREIIEDSARLLKNEKYLIIFCKDFQPKGKQTNLLHCKIINELNKIDGLEYKGMRIWHDQAMSLYPFGYPYAFVMNQIHQYILIFRKVQNGGKK